MANPALDQFTHGLFWKVTPMLLLAGFGVMIVALPLLWLRGKLERKLVQIVRARRAARESGKPGRASSHAKAAARQEGSPTFHVAGLEESPHCPECKAPMVKRMARKGANAGSEFWGCPEYPRCKGTRAA